MRILLVFGVLLYAVGAYVSPSYAGDGAVKKFVPPTLTGKSLPELRVTTVLHNKRCLYRVAYDNNPKRAHTVEPELRIDCTDEILAAHRMRLICGKIRPIHFKKSRPCNKKYAGLHVGVALEQVALSVPNLTRPAPRIITEAEFKGHLASAGWPEGLHDQMLAIARCESGDGGGLNAHARNDSDRRGPALGVLQIHVPAHLDKISDPNELYDPEVNAEVGLKVYEEAAKSGDPWLPWSESSSCWKKKIS